MADEQNNGVVVEDNNGVMTATVDREAADAAKAAAAEAKEAEGLLAGKFKTPADLEKAYNELQKKLGAPKEEQKPADDAVDGDDADAEAKAKAEAEAKEGETDDEVETVYGKAVASALKEAGVDPKAAAETFAKEGKLSDADVEAFEKAGFPKAVVDAYLRGVTGQAESVKQKAATSVEDIKAAVGGEDGFKTVRNYISSNFTQAEKEAFNAELATGDADKAMAAVVAAKARYDAEFGTENDPLTGKNPGGVLGYADDAEMMADMRKPAYKKDPAYRAKVAARIKASTYHVTK